MSLVVYYYQRESLERKGVRTALTLLFSQSGFATCSVTLYCHCKSDWYDKVAFDNEDWPSTVDPGHCLV